MKQATTLQFRDMVRKVAAKRGVDVGDSWTNGAPKSRHGHYMVDTGARTVGFMVGAHAASGKLLAAKIERKLNKLGLTADTRFTTGSVYPRGSYIRGTCSYVK